MKFFGLLIVLIHAGSYAQGYDQKIMDLLDDNKIAKAQKRFDKIGSKIMDQNACLFVQGKIYRKSGEYSKALEKFNEVLGNDSLYADAIDEIGVVKTILGEPYEVALSYYERALEIIPNNTTYLGHIGTTYFIVDKNELALKYYHRVLEIDPDNDYMLSNLGLAYARKGEHIKAILYFSKALKYRKDPKTYYDRGKSYYELDLYSDAIRDFKKAKRKLKNENKFEALNEEFLDDYIEVCKKLKN